MRRLILGAAIAEAVAPPLMPIAPAASASAATNCTSSEFAIQNEQGANMHVLSNRTVNAIKPGETEFCQTLENSSGPLYTIYEETNQSLCLSASGGGVIVTTACSGKDAEWHEYFSKAYTNFERPQWEGSKNCAFQEGPQPAPVNLQACVDKRGTTSDIWTK